MDYNNHNTTLRTNKYLNLAERFYIQKRLLAKDSISAIAHDLGRSRTTIYNEIRRGTVAQIKNHKLCHIYLADSGQTKYEVSHERSLNRSQLNTIEPFLSWVEKKIKVSKWSFDAAVGFAKRKKLFMRNEMVCTKTLYNYLHEGLIKIKPMDMPLILRRSTRKARSRIHKRKLGKSIDLRDKSILARKEFGHWEIDTVRGIKDKEDEVIISLLERKSRLYVALRCASAQAAAVKTTLGNWLNTFFQDSNLFDLCKSITSDNGREFAKIAELENNQLDIFFAHPYSAWERGSNERHNGMLRYFIPKGTPIKTVTDATLKRAINWCNNLPRKLLGYRTPQEVFLDEVKNIVDLETVQFDIAI